MLAARLDDTQRPARTHESLQFRGNEHELTACSGEIRRCPRSRYQSAPGAKSSYRNRRVRGPFWCNPITLLDPRQPALTVGVRGPPGPAARVSQRGSTSARMELISIVAATSVYAPAPIALDPFVEDSHLVGLSVRRSARCGRGKARAGVEPPRTARSPRLLDRQVQQAGSCGS